jgi:ABC-type antimicrobial peptide transport system permease subunit
LRATMLLLVLTASLAAGLAALAVYGSIWYSVTERIPEIGIRVALGATPASVCAGVVSRALLLTAVGGAIGTAATGAIAPSLRGLLFETRISDPTTLWLVGLSLAAMAATASIGPARRAMQVDPIDALRQ